MATATCPQRQLLLTQAVLAPHPPEERPQLSRGPNHLFGQGYGVLGNLFKAPYQECC